MKDLKQTLFDTLNIESLPEDQQEEIVEQTGKVIFQSIMIRVIPLLSDSEKEEFATIAESDLGEDNTAVFDYLNEKIPNLDEIVAEVIADFRDRSNDILSKIG